MSSQFTWRALAALVGPNLVTALAVLAVTRSESVSAANVRGVVWGTLALGTCVSAIVVMLFLRRQSLQLRLVVEKINNEKHTDASAFERVRANGAVGELISALNRMQRKRVAQLTELGVASQRLTTVLGSMVEGVIAVSSEERVLLANEAGKRLLDFPAEDVVGRPLIEVTRSRTVRETVSQSFEREEPLEHEFQAPGVNRRNLAMRVTRLPGSPCPGVVIVLHDTTELRRLENMRRDFMANVSHELKTPLASIKAYAETLKLGAINDPENNLTFVDKIEEQSERLEQLIKDLLQIARIESGQQAFEITNVALAPIVGRCAKYRQEDATSKGLHLQIDPPSRDLVIHGDEDALQTILDNLIDNAIKYTPSGGNVIIRWQAKNDLVVLEVIDDGIGIASRHHNRVFERFYRADKARSRELGGTGLGLAIVKHLALACGGVVAVTSETGQGSCFQVCLPLANGVPAN